MIKSLLIAATLLGAGSAYADEVIIHRDAPREVVVAPSESHTTVEHRSSSDGCATKSVHSENGMGDSKTVTKSNCD
jgi:hypothetical protein